MVDVVKGQTTQMLTEPVNSLWERFGLEALESALDALLGQVSHKGAPWATLFMGIARRSTRLCQVRLVRTTRRNSMCAFPSWLLPLNIRLEPRSQALNSSAAPPLTYY